MRCERGHVTYWQSIDNGCSVCELDDMLAQRVVGDRRAAHRDRLASTCLFLLAALVLLAGVISAVK